jgi:hypothetical protein
MVKLVARQLGETLMVLWITDAGLGRKVTASVGRAGAVYGRETSTGEWRYETIRGTTRTTFTEVKQLSALVKMLYPRG